MQGNIIREYSIKSGKFNSIEDHNVGTSRKLTYVSLKLPLEVPKSREKNQTQAAYQLGEEI